MTGEKVKEEPIVVGLDIGTTKIAAIVAQRDQFGKLKILGMGKTPSLGVSKGEVINIKQTTEAIMEAVKEAEKQSGHKITVVYVGIAGQHISSKQNRGICTLPKPEEEITRENIKVMIEDMHRLALDPGERIIHVLPQEFTVDNSHAIKDPVGMCGSRLEANFHIITGKVAAAQNIKKCVERAGLQMLGLILEPLASSAAVLHADEMEAGVVLVDIGGGTTDVAIFKDGIIRHTAVIPFAGNIITEDIIEGCKLLRPQAEKLKVIFGSALPNETHENEIISVPGIAGRDSKEISMRTLAHIVNARMEEIFAQVFFEIKSSGFVNSLNAGIVITGGGAQLKHLKQLVEYSTGLSARIGYPSSYLAKNNKADLSNPMYATGIGLVLKGYDELEDMTELEKSLLFNPRQEPVIKQADSTPTKTPVEVEQEMEEVGPVVPPKKKGANLLQQMISSVKNWFEDENVNGDFER
ncbi:MAG: cell division protein FtsA [Bacteroidetes bacterium]|nr:cell division protein FtsA [Bacteroidota bacterium]